MRGRNRTGAVLCGLSFLLGLAILIAGCKSGPPPPPGERCSRDDPDQRRSSQCSSATGKESCEAAGGNWNNGHLEKRWACDCPASKCWCKEASDCAGTCYARAAGSSSSCDGIVYGVCTATAFGCGCHLTDGKWLYMCVD